MTPTDRQQYLKIAAELAGIATRLKMICDQSPWPGVKIGGAIASLYAPSETVAKASMAIREEAERVEIKLTPRLVCPTCKNDRWAEIHGDMLYCRKCEEGMVKGVGP